MKLNIVLLCIGLLTVSGVVNASRTAGASKHKASSVAAKESLCAEGEAQQLLDNGSEKPKVPEPASKVKTVVVSLPGEAKEPTVANVPTVSNADGGTAESITPVAKGDGELGATNIPAVTIQEQQAKLQGSAMKEISENEKKAVAPSAMVSEVVGKKLPKASGQGKAPIPEKDIDLLGNLSTSDQEKESLIPQSPAPVQMRLPAEKILKRDINGFTKTGITREIFLRELDA